MTIEQEHFLVLKLINFRVVIGGDMPSRLEKNEQLKLEYMKDAICRFIDDNPSLVEVN